MISEIGDQNDSAISTEGEELNKSQQSNSTAKSEREENHHYAVELADWKSKVRKQRQELWVHFIFKSVIIRALKELIF